MEPEYDSDSTVDADAPISPVMWNGVSVYDEDKWRFKKDLIDIWDGKVAKQILHSCLTDNSALVLMHNLIKISDEARLEFIKQDVWQILVNGINGDYTADCVAALQTLMSKTSKTSVPEVVCCKSTVQRLIFVMLHCSVLQVHRDCLQILIKVWMSYCMADKKHDFAVVHHIGMLLLDAGDQYEHDLRTMILDEKREMDSNETTLFKDCYRLVMTLLYRLLNAFQKFPRILVNIFGVMLKYCVTQLPEVWHIFALSINSVGSKLPVAKISFLAHVCLAGLNIKNIMLQESAAEGLWFILRDITDKTQVDKIFTTQFIHAAFDYQSVSQLSTQTFSTLLSCIDKLSDIKPDVSLELVAFIGQALHRHKPDNIMTKGLNLMEKILEQPDGFDCIEKEKLMKKTVAAYKAIKNKLVKKCVMLRKYVYPDGDSGSGIGLSSDTSTGDEMQISKKWRQ